MASLGATYLRYARFVFVLGVTLFSISDACQTCNSPWRFVYEHDDYGTPISGDFGDLAAAQNQGARIRLLVPHFNFAEELDNALIYDDVLCGESTLHLTKKRWNRFNDEGQWRFVIACTNGVYEDYLYTVGEHEMVDEVYSDVRILWFVQDSTCPNAIFSHDEYGDVLIGQIQSLKDAVLSGYDIKTRVAEGFTFPMNNIYIHSSTGVVTGQNIWNFYGQTSTGTEWWFQMTNTQGLTDTIFWNVGEHVSTDHIDYTESVDWLVEPCWRLAYTNDANGVGTDGSLADLVAAVERGQRVKVVMGSFSVELDNVRTDWGMVSGQILSQVTKDVDTYKFQDDTSWVWQMVHTTGTVKTREYSIGEAVQTGDSETEKEIQWFVDTRQWKKVLSTNKYGDVTFGLKANLKSAIENGAAVRVGLQFARGGRIGRLGGLFGNRRGHGALVWDGDSTAWFVMKAENLQFGPDGEIAAELIKSISTESGASQEFEIQENPFWRFMLVSTESKVDFSQWRVGVNVDDGHFVRNANVNWFVNY